MPDILLFRKTYTENQKLFIFTAFDQDLIFPDETLRISPEGISISRALPNDKEDLEDITVFWTKVLHIIESLVKDKKGLVSLSMIAISHINAEYEELQKGAFDTWAASPILLFKSELHKSLSIKQQFIDDESVIDIQFEVHIQGGAYNDLSKEIEFRANFESWFLADATSTAYMLYAYRILGITFLI